MVLRNQKQLNNLKIEYRIWNVEYSKDKSKILNSKFNIQNI